MKKILVIFAIVMGIVFWYRQRESTAYLRDVENRGQGERAMPITMQRPHVDPNDPETTIRWPAFKAEDRTVPPLKLIVKKEQWLRQATINPVTEDNIGTAGINLNMNWPLKVSTEQKLDYEPPMLTLGRAPPIHHSSELYPQSARDMVYFASPPGTPFDQGVVVQCSGSSCIMTFEYLGRDADIRFGSHRASDWKAGYDDAMEILRKMTVTE